MWLNIGGMQRDRRGKKLGACLKFDRAISGGVNWRHRGFVMIDTASKRLVRKKM